MFADAAVEDSGALFRGLGADAVGYVLDGAEDGVRQVARILARHANLSAVSILAHGVEAGLTLGSMALDEAGLARRAADLRKIGRAIAPGGTLQLFACETGKGARGRALVEALSRATGTTVAAGTRVLGGAEGGGEWSLDVCSTPDAPASALPIAAGVLQGYGHALSGAASPPPGFPLDITDFSAPVAGGGSFVLHGNASLQGSALQLNPGRGQPARHRGL